MKRKRQISEQTNPSTLTYIVVNEIKIFSHSQSLTLNVFNTNEKN